MLVLVNGPVIFEPAIVDCDGRIHDMRLILDSDCPHSHLPFPFGAFFICSIFVSCACAVATIPRAVSAMSA